MRFGRKKQSADPTPDGEGLPTPQETGAKTGAETVAEAPTTAGGPPDRTRSRPDHGPYDVSEVDLDEGDWLDLGSLIIPNPPPAPVELRMQADNATGQVTSVLLVGQEGALEVRPFAASRGGGAWDELRPRLAAETTRLGGQATEEEGTFGTELVCMVPVTAPDGQPAHQVSRFAGHEGPTWLLRTNVLGLPAVEPDKAGPFQDLIRSLVVRRGPGAMAPSTPLPLTLPAQAREIQPGEGAAGADPLPELPGEQS